MDASLVMFKADGSRRDFPLRPGPMVIGRKNSCELRIPLSSVSRQHCEVSFEGDTIKLRDLGSSNGTYHNSIRVQEAELAAGDEVVVGPVVFTLVVDGVPGEIKPVRTVVASADPQSSGATISPVDDGVSLSDEAVGALGGADTPGTGSSDGSGLGTLAGDEEGDEEGDPFAQLEAMANQEKNQKKLGSSPADSSVLDFDFDDLDED
ncbi:MAG: FHA domain-containing protein [Planctomycetota bacterium]